MTAIITTFTGSDFLKEKLEKLSKVLQLVNGRAEYGTYNP